MTNFSDISPDPLLLDAMMKLSEAQFKSGVKLSLPDRPSIAVLPFDNLSGDAKQNYFSDGISGDIITELSRFRSMFVIARNSSFMFRDQKIGIAEIGRLLGVHYVLEGSVRRSDNRMRIAVQLTETETARHHWAERYDRDLTDIFAIQDEVVSTIAATVAGRLDVIAMDRVKRMAAVDLGAYDFVLRGMEFLAGYGQVANANAISMFEKAVDIAPGYAVAHAYLGLAIYVDRIGRNIADIERALDEARIAVEIDPDDSRCQRILAEISLESRHYERADFHSQRSLTLNPNDAHAAAYRAYILIHLGRPQEAVQWIGTAMRLNPFYPEWYRSTHGDVLYSTGHHAEAVAVYEQLTKPKINSHLSVAACYSKLGDAGKVRYHVEKARLLMPDFSTKSWVSSMPFARDEDRAMRMQELIEAGLPE